LVLHTNTLLNCHKYHNLIYINVGYNKINIESNENSVVSIGFHSGDAIKGIKQFNLCLLFILFLICSTKIKHQSGIINHNTKI